MSPLLSLQSCQAPLYHNLSSRWLCRTNFKLPLNTVITDVLGQAWLHRRLPPTPLREFPSLPSQHPANTSYSACNFWPIELPDLPPSPQPSTVKQSSPRATAERDNSDPRNTGHSKYINGQAPGPAYRCTAGVTRSLNSQQGEHTRTTSTSPDHGKYMMERFCPEYCNIVVGQ